MTNQLCLPESSQSYPKWTPLDFMKWKFMPHVMGGGENCLLAYKDAWVVFNTTNIQAAAKSAKIPVDLLAGVAWNEAGGDPDIMDSGALFIRTMNRPLGYRVTGHPTRTSCGSVSIQLRRAAETIGIELGSLDYKKQLQLCRCLETDVYNLNVVARHLYDLIRYDFPDADSEHLTDEQTVVVGSRYNRGTERSMKDIVDSLRANPGTKTREYSDYGRTILRRRDRVRALLLEGR